MSFCLSVRPFVPQVYYMRDLYVVMWTECVGYRLDYFNYTSSVVLMSSSNSASNPLALVGSVEPRVWEAAPGDVDSDGDFVYSVILQPSAGSATIVAAASLRQFPPTTTTVLFSDGRTTFKLEGARNSAYLRQVK